jgi:3-deoxy-D-manno-octulosonate 8-phosphate phosphatase (KDO 8-P phosphatase)
VAFLDLSNIKFVVSEVDGVITEHLAGIGEMGITLFKQFCGKDFEAINLIKRDWGFAFLSLDATISMSTCKKKNIPFFYAERNKKEVYNSILRRYSLTPDNVLYVGSAYSDIDCMKMSGFSVCPEDAVTQIKNLSDHVVPIYSGTGVLCYVYDLLLANKLNKNREE